MAVSEARMRAVRHAKDEVNSLKSRLISHAISLENAGARAEAKRLNSIIGRLEHWQNS